MKAAHIGATTRMHQDFTDDADRIRHIAELMRSSRSVLFITGAGLSADSGLPTYRGVGGLYENQDTEEGLPIEVLLSGEFFSVRPEVTWKYLLQIEQACRGARPNRGHAIIAEAETRFERVWVLTQNVDGLHRHAGSRNVIDIHGDVHRLRCVNCSYQTEVDDFAKLSFPPRCPQCQEILRPDVVLFGEALPTRQLTLYETEALRDFDLVFSIGTSSLFPYIAEPMFQAFRSGRPSVELNPCATNVSKCATIKLAMGAAAALDAIWACAARMGH